MPHTYDDLAATPWTPVTSSNISHVWHDAQKNELRIRFKDRGEYTYPGVTAEVFAQFMAAESKGKFFAERIKPTYPGEKYVAKPVNNAPELVGTQKRDRHDTQVTPAEGGQHPIPPSGPVPVTPVATPPAHGPKLAGQQAPTPAHNPAHNPTQADVHKKPVITPPAHEPNPSAASATPASVAAAEKLKSNPT